MYNDGYNLRGCCLYGSEYKDIVFKDTVCKDTLGKDTVCKDYPFQDRISLSCCV
jgi:hypothetical protein